MAQPTSGRAIISVYNNLSEALAIERELQTPCDGSAEAALAHLTLLLVGVARISVDIGHDLRLRSEPLLAAVFEFMRAAFPAAPTSSFPA